MMLGSHWEEYKRQNKEHKGLNEANKYFKPQEYVYQQQRNQCRNNNQDYFTGKDITKQPEGEREDFSKLANQLQYTYKEVNKAHPNPLGWEAFKSKKITQITNPSGPKSINLGEHYGYKGQG